VASSNNMQQQDQDDLQVCRVALYPRFHKDDLEIVQRCFDIKSKFQAPYTQLSAWGRLAFLLLLRGVATACRPLLIVRVGQNRIYTPYMAVYLMIFLPKISYIGSVHIPYIHRICTVLIATLLAVSCKLCVDLFLSIFYKCLFMGHLCRSL
jgi:hypothetical protein